MLALGDAVADAICAEADQRAMPVEATITPTESTAIAARRDQRRRCSVARRRFGARPAIVSRLSSIAAVSITDLSSFVRLAGINVHVSLDLSVYNTTVDRARAGA
jgi:hypothetical protein